MRFSFRWLSLLIVLAFLVVACGGAAQPAPATEVPQEAAEEAAEPAAEEAAEPAAEEAVEPAEEPAAAGDNVLRVRLTADIANLDPAFMPAAVDEYVATNIGEGLVSYKPGTWEVVPTLAESIEPSEDGLRIKFKLKEGIQFHGGYGEVTAEDVKYSYERFIDPELDSPYAGDWAALDRVEVTGKYTGEIILKEPFAALWTTTLPLNAGWVLSKKAIEELGDEFGTNLIGTGPYELASWTPKQEVVLRRFEDYGNARSEYVEEPVWDEIRFLPITEDSAAEIALETGEVDFGLINNASVERFQQNDAFEVVEAPTINYNWIGMNMEHPKLQDTNVRQAIRYAVDVPAILAAAYDDKWDRARAIIAPGQLGHWEDAPLYERDLDKAREYLAAAGVDSLDLKLTIENNESERALAEIVQANLAEVGINVEIEAVDTATFYELGERLEELELFSVGYVTNPDPSWSTVWFICDQVGVWNWMFWCNEEYDRLHEEALRELDPAAREEMYIEMQELWDEAVHTVWVAHPTEYYVERAGLESSLQPNARLIPWNFRPE